MKKQGSQYALAILNCLMKSYDYLDTTQLVDMVGCDRKTIYSSIAALEINGFGIDVVTQGNRNPNKYKYVGLYGR